MASAATSSAAPKPGLTDAVRDKVRDCVINALIAAEPRDGEPPRGKGDLLKLIWGVCSFFFDGAEPKKGQVDHIVTKVIAHVTAELNAANPPATPAANAHGGGADTPQTEATEGRKAPKAAPRCIWGNGSHNDLRDPSTPLMDKTSKAPCLYFVGGPKVDSTYADKFLALLKKRFGEAPRANQLSSQELQAMIEAGAAVLATLEKGQGKGEDEAANVETLQAKLRELQLSHDNLATQVRELQDQQQVKDVALVYNRVNAKVIQALNEAGNAKFDPSYAWEEVVITFEGPMLKEQVRCLEKHYLELSEVRDDAEARTHTLEIGFGEKVLSDASDGHGGAAPPTIVDHSVLVLTMTRVHLTDDDFDGQIKASKTFKLQLKQEAAEDEDEDPVSTGKSYDYLNGLLSYGFLLKKKPGKAGSSTKLVSPPDNKTNPAPKKQKKA